MKNRLFHLTKKTICMMLAAVLAFSMVLTGCDKKEIESEAQEEMTKDNRTSYTLQVVYTKVDKTKLKVNKIKDLYPNNENAFIADNLVSQPIYKAKGRNDMYMAKVDPAAVNNVAGKLVDYVFCSGSGKEVKADGLTYDTKNGIAYIPKSLYEKEGQGISIQLMMAVDPADK